MPAISKAERIRYLHKMGCTRREIADKVGCLPSYVRAALQRTNGRRLADKKCDARFRERYRTDPNFAERKRAASRKWYWTGGGRERRASHRAEARAS